MILREDCSGGKSLSLALSSLSYSITPSSPTLSFTLAPPPDTYLRSSTRVFHSLRLFFRRDADDNNNGRAARYRSRSALALLRCISAIGSAAVYSHGVYSTVISPNRYSERPLFTGHNLHDKQLEHSVLDAGRISAYARRFCGRRSAQRARLIQYNIM